MTICIGVICGQGSTLVLATDTMVTNQSLAIEFEPPAKKVTRLSDTCVALTAGDALAHTELFNAVQQELTRLKAPSVLDVVAQIKECYQEIRKREIYERILNPRGFDDFKAYYEAQRFLNENTIMMIQGQIERYDYGLEILVAGISDGVAHIYGISDPGTSNCFDAIGFNAIGSGLPHALNTLIARGCNPETSLQEALLIVYEAKKMAEKAPGVGTVTDMCIVDSGGIRDFSRDILEALNEIYERWIRERPSWGDDMDAFLKDAEADAEQREVLGK